MIYHFNLDEVLESITDVIKRYESGQYFSQEKLVEAQRVLSSNIYYLSKLQVDFRAEWQKEYYNSDQPSAVAKEREADKKVPELYACRKIIDTAKGVSISIAQELKLMSDD